MKDLMKEIEQAITYRGLWGKSELGLLSKQFINECSTNRIVCDFNTAEKVCGFFSGNRLIAYIHTEFPIGFAKKEFTKYTDRWSGNVHFVKVDDFYKPEWFVDLALLKSLAPEILWAASIDAVNPGCFSIDDFRYATH